MKYTCQQNPSPFPLPTGERIEVKGVFQVKKNKGYSAIHTFILILALIAILIVPSYSQSAEHPWPMFGQNQQHTGQSPYPGPQTLELKWSYTMHGLTEGSPAIGSDGTIYAGSHDFHLYAFRPDGTIKWTFPTLDFIRGTPAIAPDGTIYIGSADGCLYAVDSNGGLKWCYPTGGMVHSSPAIGLDGTVFVVNTNGNIFAINTDGTLKWRYVAEGPITVASPAIGIDGSIHIGTYKGIFYALNPDGTLKWKFNASGGIRTTAAISSDGTIYFGDRNGVLYALNPNGTIRWTLSAKDDIRSSPVIAQDGTIYVGSWDHNLYAINPDGTIRWRFTTDGPIEATPAIGSDGMIYLATVGGHYYAINSNGSLKSVLDGGVYHGSIAIGADNTIYVSDDFSIRAIGPQGPSPPPDTPQKPEIEVFTNQDSYTTGDTLKMTVQVKNSTSKNWKVELKTWIRLPDGKELPAKQESSVTLPLGMNITQEVYSYTFNGSELQGAYMVGGRILKPASSGYIEQSFKTVIFTP